MLPGCGPVAPGRDWADAPSECFDCQAEPYYRDANSRQQSMFKRFVLGFLVGVGLMYYYLHHGDELAATTGRWFGGAASKYRDDRQHDAAREVLNETESRH